MARGAFGVRQLAAAFLRRELASGSTSNKFEAQKRQQAAALQREGGEGEWPKSTSSGGLRPGRVDHGEQRILSILYFQGSKGGRGLEMKMPYHVTRHGEELVYELRINQADSNYCLLHRVKFAGRFDGGVCAGSDQPAATESSAQSWMARFSGPPANDPPANDAPGQAVPSHLTFKRALF